jgi:hypothetical protein
VFTEQHLWNGYIRLLNVFLSDGGPIKTDNMWLIKRTGRKFFEIYDEQIRTTDFKVA